MQKIARLMNTTTSRVFKNKFTPKQVYLDPEGKGKLVLKWRNEQRIKDVLKAGYPKGFSFDLGDFVRVQEKAHTNPFGRKAYRGIMSRELFIIEKRHGFNPHQYSLADAEKRPLLERVYSAELVKVATAYDF